MTHRTARRQLGALLDGELRAAEEAQVRAHLDVCKRCRRDVRELRAAEELLRLMPANLIPLGSSQEGEARLRGLARWAGAAAREPAHTSWRQLAGGLAAAAALVLVLATESPVHLPAMGAEAPAEIVTVAARLPGASVVANAQPGLPSYSWRQ